MEEREPPTPLTPGSVDGVLGLTEVEPSPVDETPLEGSKDYFPSQSSSSTPGHPRTSILGLGNHGPAYYLTRIQRYSSYAFTVFASLHITNTSILPLLTRSVRASESYLLLTRPYYQSALTEPLFVVLPLAAHMTSGIALRLYRRSQALQHYGAETRRDRKHIPWPVLSGTSTLGYALAPLLVFHFWTTRILPTYLHGDSALINLSYISHGFTLHPVVSFAGFTALVGVGAWHIVWGWARWLKLAPSQVGAVGAQGQMMKKRRWYGVNAVSALVAGLWLAGGLGVVGRGGKTSGWIGREFDELFRYVPVLGRWD
ncbi:hypothetical protein K432DRAFT_356803 [Lepidopterella palustris CBS 459.81]|uniref:Mitochondrial adapter protein MCP1 transmembrane domain-containing protein n=1 Tax=Lepidopterella palustris CBS 459.81 TaxID=1314670 RepID=A0A8E2JDG5_9PEZI|nr:hypothetical protein K432DRAFT_356803 [Lepidopterella palustris CBS 459.81]